MNIKNVAKKFGYTVRYEPSGAGYAAHYLYDRAGYQAAGPFSTEDAAWNAFRLPKLPIKQLGGIVSALEKAQVPILSRGMKGAYLKIGEAISATQEALDAAKRQRPVAVARVPRKTKRRTSA